MGDVVDFFVDVITYPLKLMEPKAPEIEDLPPPLDVPSDDQSSTYGGGTPINTVKEGVAIPRVYGKCRVGGNVIRANAPLGETFKILVAHSVGEIEDYTNVYINDIPWNDLSGTSHSYFEHTGTTVTQTPDTRFTDKPCAYRGTAYTAYTFYKDREIGGRPRISVVMEGLKCEPIGGGSNAYTRNPAVIMWDWYRNVEGYSADQLDSTSFTTLETYCNDTPDGGSISRYRFDYSFDTDVAINDAKKIIWSSFNGRVIWSQVDGVGKLKPVWEQTESTISHAFTMDNIVEGSFTFSRPRRPNIVRVHYVDSDNEYKKSMVEMRDEQDISDNVEQVWEENCLFITNVEIASRRCQFKFDKFKHTDYTCALTGFSNSSHLEVFDRVTVTHNLPNPVWAAKDFIVKSKSEDEFGRPTFLLEAYYASIYHDKQTQQQINEWESLPYIWGSIDSALTVSNVTAQGMYSSVSDAMGALPDTGGRIIIKAGTYDLGSGVTFPQKSVWLEGEQQGGVTLTGTAGYKILRWGDTSIRHYRLSSLVIQSQTTKGHAIFGNMIMIGQSGVPNPNNNANIVLEGCRFAGTSIYKYGSSGGDRAIYNWGFGDTGSLTIRDCNFYNLYMGYFGYYTNQLLIEGCTFDEISWNGIQTSGAFGDQAAQKVLNNVFRNIGNIGISCDGDRSLIKNNLVSWKHFQVADDPGGNTRPTAFIGIVISQNNCQVTGNTVLMDDSGGTRQAWPTLKHNKGIIFSGDSGLLANNHVYVDVSPPQHAGAFQFIGIQNSALSDGNNICVNNKIELYNYNTSRTQCSGTTALWIGNYRCSISNNHIEMTGDGADGGIHSLGGGYGGNYGVGNITYKVGVNTISGAGDSIAISDS